MKKLNKYAHDYPQIIILSLSLLAFIFIFIGLSVSYINKFNETLLAENESHLSEIADHIAIYTKSIIDDTTHSLQNAAYSLVAIPENQRMDYMEDIAKRQEFAYIGYAKKDGYFQATEETQNRNIKNELAFKNALSGQTTISDLERRVFNDHVVSGIIITVPIYSKEHETIGSMSAMISSKKLDDALEIDSFQGKGYSYIINQKGDLILHNKSMDYSNFYRILDNAELLSDNTLDEIKDHIKNGDSGLIEYKQLGIKRYTYYTKIDINSWTILNTVDSDVITEKTDMMMKELIVIASCFIIAFLVLLIIAGISWVVSANQKHISRTKSIFLTNMSQQIQKPMDIIINTAHKLLESDLNDNQKKQIESIFDSSQNLLMIMNNVLDFSKIEVGKLELTDELYDLDAILYDIANSATSRLNEKNVSFMVEINKEVPNHLFGDVKRVKQILMNLVDRAIEYTEQGFIQLSVSSYMKDQQFYLEFKIKDTGTSIKKETTNKFFEKELQEKQYDDNQNSSLGIAMSQSLSQLMNGYIQVESQYGMGTTFTVVIQQRFQDKQPIIHSITSSSRICICESRTILQNFYKTYLDQTNIQYKMYSQFSLLENDKDYSLYDYICINYDMIKYLPEDIDFTHFIILINSQEQASYLKDKNLVYIPMFGIEFNNIFI
ncbi:sensor histidine kinase [Candidatus Stoquefichus massiliensis]|uniref:sensor histidine kinase n=1 Tax=Candidatus Stoquefichus massiliensis TaxID=1470350 RepID=UPI000483BB1B|nr:ATP-binding protein [Candidatus Stoquefichus massiliensis]